MLGVLTILLVLEVRALAMGQALAVREKPALGQLTLSHPLSPLAFSEEKGKWVRLIFQGKPLWQYNYGVAAPPNAGELNATSGFLHPVWSLKGAIVTDWGPPDHYHHRGIFFAWVKTRWGNLAPDFWNLFAGSGRTRFEVFEGLELHADQAIMVVRHVWHAKQGEAWVPVVHELWTLTTYAPSNEAAPHWWFDLTTELTNGTDKPLVVEEHRYGGLGYRGARVWWETQKWEVLTDEGKTREDADATDTRWVMQGGAVNGDWAGVTIMDHPHNFGFPGRLRVAPTFPYVGFAPMRKAAFTLNPKERMRFRYRFVVHSLKPTPQELDALWKQFAQ